MCDRCGGGFGSPAVLVSCPVEQDEGLPFVVVEVDEPEYEATGGGIYEVVLNPDMVFSDNVLATMSGALYAIPASLSSNLRSIVFSR